MTSLGPRNVGRGTWDVRCGMWNVRDAEAKGTKKSVPGALPGFELFEIRIDSQEN
jgi:hypothetical protein